MDAAEKDGSLEGENIVCFAGEDWWFHNPHSNFHLMRSFAKKNRVLFVNSTGIKTPDFRGDRFAWRRVFNKLKSLFRYLKKAEENIYVWTPLAFPLQKKFGRSLERLNYFLLKVQMTVMIRLLRFEKPIVWVTSPAAKDIALDLKRGHAKCLVHYCADNLPFYPGADRERLSELESALQKSADLTLFVNHRLLEERRPLNQNARYLGHGVDYDHFAGCQASPAALPIDIQKIPTPIVGYMGEIQGLDFNLVRYLADRNKGVSFVFIGEVYEDLNRVPLPANVYFLGKRPYALLPDYLRPMACLCLYYKTDDTFNRYRNPKKLLEYLSTGKPVVSVPILEMDYFSELVHVAKDYAEFDRFLRSAIQEDSAVLREKRMAFALSRTWDAVAAEAARYLRAVYEKN